MVNMKSLLKKRAIVITTIGFIIIVLGFVLRQPIFNAGFRFALHQETNSLLKLFVKWGADQSQINQILIVAVDTNSVERGKLALRLGANPNLRAAKNDPVLFWAAHKNHFEMAQLLVQHGATMDYTTATGWSILSMIIHEHFNEIAELFITSGADLDPPNKDIRRKPLWIAVKRKNMPMLKILLARGVKTPMYDAEKTKKMPERGPYTLLQYALLKKNYEGAKLLITGHGKGRLPDELLNGSPFISNECLIDIKRALTKRELENVSLDNKYPIIDAINNNRSTSLIIELLNQNPSQIDEPDGRGITPLISAIEANRKDIVEELIRQEVNLETADRDGIPPLAIAASLKCYPIFRCLVRAGANLTNWGCHGNTIFSYIIERNDIQAMSILKEEMVDVNCMDSKGPPLVHAMIYGHVEIARLLLDAGADPYISGRYYPAGEHYIRTNSKFAELKSYLKKSAQTKDNDDNNTPSFDCAQARNKVEMVICENKELAGKDRMLNRKYDLLSYHKKAALKKEQREWLRKRNDCQDDNLQKMIACINDKYDKRLAEFDDISKQVLNSKSSSWQKQFVKNLDEIPIQAFRAYYFDERLAGKVKRTDIVDRPAVNFTNTEYFGIPGDNFGAYWIGFFDYADTTNILINVYQGRAESKIIIDGEIIPKAAPEGHSKYKKTIPYTFTPGRHKIEVQFVSNYFSVSFLVNILPEAKIHNDETLAEIIANISNPTIWYCGAYESDKIDMSAKITLKKSKNPVVLFLSSYQPVVWKLMNSDQFDLHTVVLSSYGPMSSIEHAHDNVQVLYYDSLPYVYELIPDSSSSGSRKSFKNIAYKIQSLTGKKPTGFSGKYGLTSITIPESILDDATYSQFGMRLNGTGDPKKAKSGSRLDRVFE